MTIQHPTLDEIRAAAEVQKGVVRRTPLIAAQRQLDRDAEILLKLETLQPITSFKLRGIFHAVATMTEEDRSRGLSTVSAGNTAQALAWCGRHFGVTARSLMPETAPPPKIAKVEALGGTPVLVPTDEVFRFLRESGWNEEPYSFVHPWIDRRVLVGHGSLGLEILEQDAGVETIYVSVGGGGLAVGVASAAKALRPQVQVIAVEPATCPALATSLERGRPTEVSCQTISDGVAVPYITEEMYPLLEGLIDDVVLIDEERTRKALRELLLEEKLLVEPSGALTYAAALDAPPFVRGRAACVLSGASVDPALLRSVLDG
ncbi:MAG: pyridoxal-phosphate dependent enzyme [Acidobacteriota bacterium]